MDDKIIDFRSLKNKEPKAPVGVPGSNVYVFHMKDGTEHEHEGQLITTPSFFACGVPLVDSPGVDFSFAAPIDLVNYVERIDDEDLIDD